MALLWRNRADRAEIMANTANILARYRREAEMANRANILVRGHREADTRSAAAGRNSVEANRQNPATGEVETGAAVTGAAIRGIMDSPVVPSSSSVDLAILTTGVGTPLGAGAFHTRLTMAMILMGIILRMGTIMVTTATQLTETAMDLRLANCSAGWPELATTMARSME